MIGLESSGSRHGWPKSGLWRRFLESLVMMPTRAGRLLQPRRGKGLKGAGTGLIARYFYVCGTACPTLDVVRGWMLEGFHVLNMPTSENTERRYENTEKAARANRFFQKAGH